MFAGDPLPHLGDITGAIVMGGPMGAFDDDAHPWLANERAFIESHVGTGGFYWGVCLGAQLLAGSLGADVWRGPVPEVGVLPVELTRSARDDMVFGCLPLRFEVLQWHNDTFDLPTGATLLASSEEYQRQAFRIANAWGLQFHLEAPVRLVSTWLDLEEYRTALQEVAGSNGAHGLLADLARTEDGMARLAKDAFGAWVSAAIQAWPSLLRTGVSSA